MFINKKIYYLIVIVIFVIASCLLYLTLRKQNKNILKNANNLIENKSQSPCAMITGGARGIGKAYAIALLDRGYKVVILDKLNAQKTALELSSKYGINKVLGIHFYITNNKLYKNAFIEASNFANDGILDIIILNAGILTTLFYKAKELIETNLLAPIYGTEMYIKQITNGLKEPSRKQGLIVITSSKAGVIPFDSDISPVYNASKAALNHFVLSMEPFAVRFNFRINAICPSFTNTEMNSPFLHLFSFKTPIIDAKKIRKNVKSIVGISPTME